MATRTLWYLTAKGTKWGWYASADKYKGTLGSKLGVEASKAGDDIVVGARIPAAKLRLNGENAGVVKTTTVYCAPSKLEAAQKELKGEKFKSGGKDYTIRTVGIKSN